MLKLTDLTPELLNTIEAMSIYRPLPSDIEPVTKLTQWRVFSVYLSPTEETVHLVGYAGYEGRVCSPVLEYDSGAKKGKTRSRTYQLVGSSGHNRDAMYVWAKWLRMNGNPAYKDITEQYE